MNIKKLIQVVHYVLKKYDLKLNYTKLLKLLYLSDRQALGETGASITGDAYYSLDNGPILSCVYDLIRGKASYNMQNIWDAIFITDGYDVYALSKNIPYGELSEYEKRILDIIDAQYHDKTYQDMISIVHDKMICPEWRAPEQHGATKIHTEEILNAFGWSAQDIEIWKEEYDIFLEEEKILKEVKQC